jgi:polynucleotide 5'-triphosphatase
MDIDDGPRPLKRVRTDVHKSTSSALSPLSNMPPLSLSILGVEPVDEFIREVADFIHHMIGMRPRDLPGAMVEVEAKIGILRDRLSGNRLNLPVLTETSEFTIHPGHCFHTLTRPSFE